MTAAALEALVGFVAEHVIDAQRRWLLRDNILFLDAMPPMLSTEALHAMPPERTVLTMTAADMADPDTLSAVQALRAGGVGILVRDGDLGHLGNNLGKSASYIEVRFSGADVAFQARTYAALKQSTARMVGRPVTT